MTARNGDSPGRHPRAASCHLQQSATNGNRTPDRGQLGLDLQPRQVQPRGTTYDRVLDRERLGRQLRQVLELMLDGRPRTIQEIAEHVEGAQTALSARLRDLRRLGYTVESCRIGVGGTWRYRIAARAS